MTQELNAALEELDAPVALPTAVHRCRLRLKRARSLGRVGKTVAPGLAAVFNDSARVVMRQLGRARDLSALADTARMLAETANTKGAAALIAASDALETERKSLPELDFDSVRTGIRDLLALAQVWPEASLRQIKAGTKHVAKRARYARRLGKKSDEAELRHEWRKREKDRLYAATLLDSAWPGPRRRKQNGTLGHLLGRERDAILLLERIEAQPALAGSDEAAERARRVLKKYTKRLRRRADKLGQKLHENGA